MDHGVAVVKEGAAQVGQSEREWRVRPFQRELLPADVLSSGAMQEANLRLRDERNMQTH
jgi:hypothetical protein